MNKSPSENFDLYSELLTLEPELTNEDLILIVARWLRMAEEHESAVSRTLAAIAYSDLQRLMNEIARLKYRHGESTQYTMEALRKRDVSAFPEVH